MATLQYSTHSKDLLLNQNVINVFFSDGAETGLFLEREAVKVLHHLSGPISRTASEDCVHLTTNNAESGVVVHT